jgi:alpha-beta hydrolase superfamily lysophospholipase
MSIRELEFASYNGRDSINAWIYTPIRKPRGIVQVVHGLGEHSRRYLHLILKLNEAGFVVAADDHTGHGKTAAASKVWGDYGTKGYQTTAEDEKTLHDIVTKEFPGLPFVLFGHSWGSMIARNYAAMYASTLKALVLCGTCGTWGGMEPLGEELKELVDAGKGADSDPAFMGRLFAGWVDRFENAKTPNDWISADPDIVADHATDPFNNLYAPLSNRALYDILELAANITGPEWAGKLPPDLPVYLIAGDQDPVGNYGEGVLAVANWLWQTGHKKIVSKLYSGHRHEIHNDRDIREEVTDGIIDFINAEL